MCGYYLLELLGYLPGPSPQGSLSSVSGSLCRRQKSTKLTKTMGSQGASSSAAKFCHHWYSTTAHRSKQQHVDCRAAEGTSWHFTGPQGRTHGAGQMVEAAGSLRVRIWRLLRVSDRCMQIAGQLQGMSSAGSVKGARGILARGCATESATSACLTRFYFEQSQKWNCAAAPFLGPFWQPLFPKIKFFGGLVFGAAWQSLFWRYSCWRARLA